MRAQFKLGTLQDREIFMNRASPIRYVSWSFYLMQQCSLRVYIEDCGEKDAEAVIKQKGPLNEQWPFVTLNFRSYDNHHTICQNLPEAAETSAEAEGGQ
jgi:hypothetical protein